MQKMKKLLSILILSLLLSGTAFAKEITIQGYLDGKNHENIQIQRYIQGNIDGIYSGLQVSNALGVKKLFCVPEGLEFNTENLMNFIDSQIEISKSINFYKPNHPISFYLQQGLEKTFPCKE